MATFQFGSDNASFEERGIGEGLTEAIKLRGCLGFEMPCMLRVVMVQEGGMVFDGGGVGRDVLGACWETGGVGE